MKIRFRELRVTTKRTVEVFTFSDYVTFLHGPIGAGKSSVARLIDFCFGGRLERTPAIQREFISARLFVEVGKHTVGFERGATDSDMVRVTWEAVDGDRGSVNAPLDAGDSPLLEDNVWNLSDLIFWLAGIEPIKVRRGKRDPNSPLVRLSFRDLLWYCYLKQDKLDGSFFRLEDTFKKYKSMDAMRFVTGLYSERLSELDGQLAAAVDEQRSKREAVVQIRRFLERFELGTEIDLAARIEAAKLDLAAAVQERERLDREQASATHLVEPLRVELRELSADVGQREVAVEDLRQRIRDQNSVRSELITAKVKAQRADAASSILGRVTYSRCPCCGTTLGPDRQQDPAACHLCLSPAGSAVRTSQETEVLQRELNARIDDLAESITRHKREVNRAEKALADARARKATKDLELASELKRYDSAFVAAVRAADRRVAALQERIESLQRLGELPAAILNLEKEAGELQGKIDILRSALEDERGRLRHADHNIQALEDRFLSVMRTVGFPGVSAQDSVEIDPRNWDPKVIHGADREVVWGFFDAGSGGKKTLFNVCYALALHEVARAQGLPLPTFLIIDSPSKNFGRDINRPLATAMFQYAYGLARGGDAAGADGPRTQLLLIDSDFVPPANNDVPVVERLMVPGDPDHPPLISYYSGP